MTCLLIGLSSCSSHSEGSSFTSKLDSVDACISQGSTDDAVKLLKKLEKKAYTSYEFLGITKRYLNLGEDKRAEKILSKALKRIPKNPEVSCVYANFLLRHDRLDEAFEISLPLAETEYSSIYSECILRKTLLAVDQGFSPEQEPGQLIDSAFNSSDKKKKKKQKDMTALTSEQIKEIFTDERFIPVYTGAFKGSKDSPWIYNAASVLMKNGRYKDAAGLYPHTISSYRDSLLWGIIFFDTGLYTESLDALTSSKKLAQAAITEKNAPQLTAEIDSLTCDCLYIEDEDEKSHQLRLELLATNKQNAPSLAFMNSAMYYKRHDSQAERYDQLMALEEQFPDYIPGIAGKAEFALDELRRPPEDELSLRLRSAGLKTLAMEERDRIPTISVATVTDFIDSRYSQTGNPDLMVLKERIRNQKNFIQGSATPVSAAWTFLESMEEDNAYPSQAILYGVEFLVQNNLSKEAEGLFDGYIKGKYDYDVFENPAELELWEAEYSAWFACLDGDLDRGLSMYTHIMKNYGDRIASTTSQAGRAGAINAFINLAVLYESTDRLEEAVAMLSHASSRCTDPIKKAEILYRSGELSWKMGDSHSASRSLKYALKLDPSHNRSRLLLKKITAES